jgi:hypothetical protein
MTDDYKRMLGSWAIQAIEHWREFRPDMVAELEAEGRLEQAAQEAEDKTFNEMQGLMNGPGKLQWEEAWQLTREKYLFLPPGDGYEP